MKEANIIFAVSLIVLFISYEVSSERIKNKIYKKIDAASACFRRLNGTHQIGCTSKEKGNIGVVHVISKESDLDYVLNDGPHHPYAVLIENSLFTRKVMLKIKASDKINGVMIRSPLDKDILPSSFSPDVKCPLDNYGLYKDSAELAGCSSGTNNWNEAGEGLMFMDFNFPIFVLTNSTDIDFIIKCFSDHNDPANKVLTNARLCAVQLKDRMDGAKDAETCVRRTQHQLNLNPDRYCDPLGDQNVYATLKGVNSSEEYPSNSLVIVGARLDSFSMFENQYPSADSVVTGIVALLAAAEVVGKFREEFTSSSSYKDLAFMFFQGEAFDYIGSARMVYDMSYNQFPVKIDREKTTLHNINLNHISSFVEVSQLGFRDQGKLWLHTDPVSYKNSSVARKVDEMIDSLKEIGQSVNSPVDIADRSLPLPPASVQSFLKKLDIPAVVITDHQRGYTNRYYNSYLDLAQLIGVNSSGEADYDEVTDQAANLTRTATMLAQFLYKTVTGKNATEDMVASNSTVTHLLNCFLVSPKCDLFKSVMTEENADVLDDKPYQFYVGVDYQTNHVTSLTQYLLARYLGEDVTENMPDRTACVPPANSLVYQYYWMQGVSVEGKRNGSCFKSTSNTSIAKSIAFDTNDWTSGKYSTWTESAWGNDAIQMQVFLIPSKQLETITLSIGVILFLGSMLVVYFFNARVDILFAHPGPSRNY